jgi:thiamine biosynthesis protein ThiC
MEGSFSFETKQKNSLQNKIEENRTPKDTRSSAQKSSFKNIGVIKSMSTDVNSNTGTSNQFVNIMSSKEKDETTTEANSKKHLHHKYDETLSQAAGDISIVMKISTNQIFANKILIMLKGLASHIKLSID